MSTIVGVITGLFISSDPNSLVSRRVPLVRVLENGFEGDKHQGWLRKADVRAKRYAKGTLIWNSRQISIVSEGELAFVAKEMGVPKIEPEWLGANICLSGVPDLSLLPPRTKIFIPNKAATPSLRGGEVGIYITAPNKPCIGPGEVIQANYLEIEGLATKFPKAAMNKRGVVAVVERGGLIEEGDLVSVVIQ